MTAEISSTHFTEKILVRFGASLLANLTRGGLSFAAGVLVARGLGPVSYGDLSFLAGSFTAIGQILDMGTSSAFFTFISSRRRAKPFFIIYAGWLLFQFVAPLTVLGLFLPSETIREIWIGHQRGIVLLAFGASFMTTQAYTMVSQLGEAVRKTVLVQIVTVGQASAHVGLIAVLNGLHWMSVSAVLWLLLGEYFLLAFVLGPWVGRHNVSSDTGGGETYGAVLKEYVSYCRPLVLYTWIGFLCAFADTWLLQYFGGAEQQGFFAIGQQFANIALVITSSVLRIFWKEIAEAKERGDRERVRVLYIKVTRSLYFSSAVISCFLIPHVREVIGLILGPSYIGASSCLAVMLLYPVLQSLGQSQSAFFYASSATRSVANIGTFTMLLSIPVTYVLLGPKDAFIPGFSMGALGLVLRLVAIAIIGVALQGMMIAKLNGWTYEYAFYIRVIALLLVLSFLSKWCISLGMHLLNVGVSTWIVVLGSFPVYALPILGLLGYAPQMLGMSTEDISIFKRQCGSWRGRLFARSSP